MKWSFFILSTGTLYRKMFADNNMGLTSAFMTGLSHKALLYECYLYLVSRNVFGRIEELPAADKWRLFNIIKELEAETKVTALSKEEIILTCKSWYALE